MIKTAQLRVYLPEGRSTVRDLPLAERVDVPVHDVPYGITGESLAEDALAAHWNHQRYLCPRTPRLRMLEGVLAIRQAYRQLGSAQVVPEDVARSARRELEAMKDEDPDVRAHILTSAWHVPMRWFAPFEPSAKEVVSRGDHVSVRYRISYSDAMRRLTRAIGILASVEIPEAITAEVVELREWLDGFPRDAMVELDYGSVSEMFSEMDLVLDDSVAEIWESLESLAVGDWDKAGDHYGTLVTRWAAPMSISSSN